MLRVICSAIVASSVVIASCGLSPSTPRPSKLSPAFFGTWKESPSDESSPIISEFERKADGIHGRLIAGGFQTGGTDLNPQGFAYDGIDRPSAVPGTTEAWTKKGRNTYEQISKHNGKVTMVVTRTISTDGNTMSMVNIYDGTTTTGVWKRIGESKDPDLLLGTWKDDPKSTSTSWRLIVKQWRNGLSISLGTPDNTTLEVEAEFDGRDYPWSPTEKGFAPLTASLAQLNELAFVAHVRLLGQPFKTVEYVLSFDGKTLKQTTTLTSSNESGPPVVSNFVKE
jgi:hypothetical protein